MNLIFRRRAFPELTSGVTVTVTGKGSGSICYATINGTKITAAGTYEVEPGDTITLGVTGGAKGLIDTSGRVIIDGTTVLAVTDGSYKTYPWTVPSGISQITINLSYAIGTSGASSYGRITVTTA